MGRVGIPVNSLVGMPVWQSTQACQTPYAELHKISAAIQTIMERAS
jgi:hypothetical protein